MAQNTVNLAFRRSQPLAPVLAIAAALLVGAGLAIAGVSLLKAYSVLFSESLTNYYGLGNTLTKMAPLLLTSLGVLVALKAGQFNIGGEGQIYMGGLGSAAIGLYVHELPATDFLSDFLAARVRLSVPLAFAAIGGLWSERSGVLNIALEGLLLTGAFTSAVAAFATGSAPIGLLATAIVGGLVGLLHAYLCVTLRVGQLVSGLAINLSAGCLAQPRPSSYAFRRLDSTFPISFW